MEERYGNILTIILVVAIIAVLGVLGFFAYKIYVHDETQKDSQNIVADFDEATKPVDKPESSENQNNNETQTDENTEEEEFNFDFGNELTTGIIPNNSGNGGNSGNSGSKDVMYKGFKVIGTISIPSIDLQYPILEGDSTEKLDVAICAVFPNKPELQINNPGNLILWGHNYKDGTFFSNLHKLSTGSKIFIKDTKGNKVEYEVFNTYETTDSDFSYTSRNTEGRAEISLSTCSGDAGKRTIVWARAK